MIFTRHQCVLMRRSHVRNITCFLLWMIHLSNIILHICRPCCRKNDHLGYMISMTILVCPISGNLLYTFESYQRNFHFFVCKGVGLNYQEASTLSILETPKRILWQTVKTQKKCSIAFHQGLHCLLRFKQPSGTDIHYNLENSTGDPLKHTMGSPILNVSICMGNSTRKRRVEYGTIILSLQDTVSALLHILICVTVLGYNILISTE